jgi:hypothetical protein
MKSWVIRDLTLSNLWSGEAKGELRNVLSTKGKGRIVDIETVDKMTDRQIAAKFDSAFYNRVSCAHPSLSGIRSKNMLLAEWQSKKLQTK